MNDNSIDQLNKKTMCDSVSHYAQRDQFTAAEQSAINCISNLKEQAILDIGVGGGRTVKPLLQLSNNYTGLDYVEEMVQECRSQYPGISFKQADARDLSEFKDNSFQLIMFSMNGISMVDHEGRIKILNEVFRLLSPGGYFLFSTYNQDNSDYKKLFQLPYYSASLNPLKFAVRSIRFFREVVIMTRNRLKYKNLEFISDQYAMINDKCHHYATMLYYITHANQKKQLIAAGFSEDIQSFDLDGAQIKSHTNDDSIFYVAKKQA